MSDRHRRVKELFLEARSLPSHEREAWLEAACGDESERADVVSLLDAEAGLPADYLAPQLGSDLAPGAVFGRYEIVEHLSSGGMGDVWLARDETLGRCVALKFPVEGLMGGPSGRLVRSEARAAAALDHPAVCRVFELGETDGRAFIVMEYLQGETLADRLRQGRVPLSQALAWAAAIAGALEEAHEKGLLHRDLKPANVMVTRSGEVKVIDFGLARATPEPAGETDSGDGDGASATGWTAGTPAYMPPERLRGQPVDERSDIWAFGCVLYELLTGRRAFDGDTTPEAVAAILEGEPDWEPLPAEASSEIRRLVGRCLRKDPGQRLRHVGDALLVLEEAARDEPAPGAPEDAARPNPARPWWRRIGVRTVAALMLSLAVVVAAWQALQPGPSPDGEVVHATFTLPPGVRVVGGGGISSSVAVSPDGGTVVVAATDEVGRRLYVRPIGRPEAVPLAGTEGGVGPFFSPDGAWIGYFADGRLRRVPAEGGAAVDIAGAPGFPLGGSWGDDDRIVFSAGPRSALQVVPARGGDPAPLTTLDTDAGEVSHRHPELLPDGRTLLFTSLSLAGWSVHALDFRSGRRAELTEGATPRYVRGGHLVVNRGNDLLTAPFDPARLELRGPLVPVVQNVVAEMASTLHYGVSRSGTLAYVPAPAVHALVIIQDGVERIVDEGPWPYARPPRPRFSPDGMRLALSAGQTPDVWIRDLASGSATRLTFEGGATPVWTPEGNAVTFAASPFLGMGPGRLGLYTQPIDGRFGAERLLAVEEWHRPIGWTPDGRMLAFEEVGRDATPSIWVLADGEARKVVEEAYAGRLSPDGRWLAYQSEGAKDAEVYVTPFPEADGRWQISAGGGSGPAWSPGGTEVYYRSADRLIAARLEMDAGVAVTSRRVVLERFTPSWPDDYDIHPDGRGLVLFRPSAEPREGEIGIVVNWATELPLP